jgi:hypothetical protein
MGELDAILAIIAKVATLPTLPVLLVIWYRITRLERILPFLADLTVTRVRECRQGCLRGDGSCPQKQE